MQSSQTWGRGLPVFDPSNHSVFATLTIIAEDINAILLTIALVSLE